MDYNTIVEARTETFLVLGAGVVTVGFAADLAVQSHELSKTSSQQAIQAYEVTSTLDSAESSLTFYPSSSVIMGGKIPTTIYKPAVLSDTDAAKTHIKHAQELMVQYPANTDESRQILDGVVKSLPEQREVSSITYGPQIIEISRGREHFIQNLDPSTEKAYMTYDDTMLHAQLDGLGLGVSAIMLTGFVIGVAAIGDLRKVGKNIKEMPQTVLNRLSGNR
jgi:hypothetical protein